MYHPLYMRQIKPLYAVSFETGGITLEGSNDRGEPTASYR